MRRAGCGLVVVMAALAALFTVPAVQRLRAKSDRVRCENNLRLMALMGDFPSGTIFNAALPVDRRLSWYAGQFQPPDRPDWSKLLDRSRAWDESPNRELAGVSIAELVCPALVDQPGVRPAFTTYVGLTGLGADSGSLPPDSPRAGAFRFDEPTPKTAITDGLSHTIGVIETSFHLGPWLAGGEPTLRAVICKQQPYFGTGRPFDGCHQGLTLAAFADGSVRSITPRVNPRIFEALVTIAGGPVEYEEP